MTAEPAEPAESALLEEDLPREIVGIGAFLGIDGDGSVRIRGLLTDGPAARSGEIEKGDTLLAVERLGEDPVDVAGLPLSEVVGILRGPRGTSVRLHVRRGDPNGAQPKVVTLVRASMELATVPASAPSDQ